MHYNIRNIISINKGYPLYKFYFNEIKKSILNGRVSENKILPPTRVLSKDLSISRTTALKVYDLLLFEGLISSKKGSGYYVTYKKNIYVKKDQKKYNLYPSLSKKSKLFKKNRYLSTDNFSRTSVAFRPGLPPLDIFPVNKWKNISNKYWRLSKPTDLSYAPAEGLEELRIKISNYLKIYRNIRCDYNQIIITSGSLHSLYLISNSILDNGDKIGMENPTFPRAFNLFKCLKAKIIPCDIDKEGIVLDNLNTKVKFIYTTPSNQYPLGVRMSLNRRKEILKWISNNNSLIIEDDYDHEFSNFKNPIPSLYSLDNEDRIIYLGTFNKLLHPSLRIGYMIAPKFMLESIKSIYEQSSRFVPSSTQEIMSTFIEKDYLNKHIRNVIEVASKRKELFISNTKETLLINKKEHNGLHLIAKFKNKKNDLKIFKSLLKSNVVAYPLSNYYITKNKKNGLVMGYSSVNSKVLNEKTAIINQVLKK
ncbi:MAG: PLP-dependent aminotransferase family protein [Flavobacteriaceae bacterium]|nr:PLP-dependent aminotransferase family protein [Flavobacteriaceae bacterium]